MGKKYLLMTFLVAIIGFCGTSLSAQNVAKVGNTEYATIDEAIAAWTNNTTLTLLANVTLSDVVTIKSTEHHILNLGTYTMTAASGKNAFVIQACGTGSAERSAITINADATNPGGIDAGSKCVVYYKYADGGISTEDRPIIKINGGVFTGSTSSWGTAGIYTIGTAARKCATVNVAGGTFNCSIVGSGKSKLIVSGGLFNYTVSSQGDSTCSRLISGGIFKTFGFMTADSNNTKFWIGTSMGNSNVGAYIDDKGYLVVGGPVVTEPGTTFEASSPNISNAGFGEYLTYSSVATNGIYYTSVEEALADNNKSGGSVTVHVDELDMADFSSYKGTIVVPADSKLTITNAPATLVVKDEEGNVLEANANGSYTTIVPDYSGEGTETSPYIIASIDDLSKLRNKVNGGETYEGVYFKLTSDITLTGEWTPIGNGSRSSSTYTGNAFKGVFDGYENTIDGLNIANGSSDETKGLFGVVDGGTVKNLKLTNVNISTSSKNVGAAAGLMVNNATIDNVEVSSGTLTVPDGVGGIVGRMIIDGTISNCTNKATVSATTAAGGIVGKAYYSALGREMNITVCTNEGNITGSYAAGGIAALSAANISGCSNIAVIASNEAGGIVGEQIMYGTINNNVNSGLIKNINNDGFAHGGIIGWIRYHESTTNYPLNGIINVTNNTNTANIEATGAAGGSGGIVGHIYNQANVTGNTNKAEHIYGGAFAAGIAGSLQQATGNLDIENTTITVSNNISLTSIENITVAGLCKDLFAYNNDAANFVVKDNSANPPVAKIGETKYATLEAAFAAATEGQTITLLADATPTLTSQRAITKAAVIDLGGKTLTLTEDDLYFGTTTFQNGNIVVDPSVKPSTAVFWMFANQTLTFDNVKIVATGVTGTYLIGLDGNNSDLNIINGSEIIIENTTALDLDVICVNASTGNDIVVEDSKVNVTNLDGRVFFRGNYTVKDSEVNLDGITKAGFRIEAGQTLSIEGTSVVNITGEPRDGGIHLTDITSTYTKAETATVNATVNEPKVAKVGENTYRTFAEAAAAAQAGSEIILLANIEGDITVPANVTLNGNGFAISGAITADGTITFAGVTKAGNFGVKYVNTVVNIPAGASLQLTGTDRMVIGHGCTFNITGSIEDAKTADKAVLTPSLIMPGASFTGAGVTFNVTNAYIKTTASYCSSSKSASSTFDFNIKNSIWEQFGKLAFESQSVNATVNFDLVNSVLTTTSHLVFGVSRGEVVIDNSNVNVGTSRQIENQSTMTIKNGSVVNGAVATSSNAKNPGTIIVENATYAVTGEFSGSDLGTGTLIVKKGANVSVGSIKAGANVVVDAEGMAAGDEINFTADLSQFTGTLSVINNDNLEAKIVDGKVVLAAKPAAKIGETPYTTLEAAFKAATSGCTIDILSDVTVDYNWDARYTGGKFTVPVTINGNDKTIKFTASVNDNNYQAPFRFEADATVKNLTIDMSEVTDNRFRAISSKGNLTVDGCKFIGKDETLNCRAVIFGEGAGANVGNLAIAITNSEFINWKRGITDNENAQDVKTVTITGNTLTDAGVGVSAKETVTFTGNTVAGAYVNIKSYTAGNKLQVTATGNTLEQNTDSAYNVIDAGGKVEAEGFKIIAKGNGFTGYTRTDAIWGEVWGNATESFVIKVLDANGNVMGTTSLNNVNGIIDGDVNVTWSLKFDAASNTDEYWTMSWTTAPTIDNMPAKVELWVDGVKVSGGNVVLNGPDNINKIYAAVTDNTGKILAYHTNVQEAVKAAAAVTGVARATTAGTVEFLSDVTVDKWIMFAEKMSIGDGSLITLNINGVTIDGNNNTLTVKSIESAGNGGYLFYDAQNLTVKDLTINIADGLVGGIGLQSGTIRNVTFNGGQYAVLPGANGVTIDGCTFNDTKGYAIYYEDARPGIVVDGNTFNTAEGKYAITMRSDEQFTNNTITKGRVNLANSAASTVSGNDFGTERFKVYNGATATISDNEINNLVFNETDVPTESTFTNNILSPEAQAAIDALPAIAGEGTEANPYLIDNVDDLVWLQEKVDELAQDGSTQFAGKYFKLTNDIDLSGINWNPIGTMNGDHGSFKGVFDGGDHTISNLHVEQAGNGIGLFARTAGNAVIKNLKLNNVTVKSTNNSNYVGGLVGNAYASTKIENVHVSGNVCISGRGYIGGIAGHGYVVMDNVSVVATGDGHGNDKGLITSTFWCAGGVLGYAGEGATNIMNAHVENVVVTSAAGGLGAIVGMAEDNNGTQPISGSNLSAKKVEIKTYTGAYGDSYANYALGYLYGGNPTSILTGDLSVDNVIIETSNGVAPEVNDAVAQIGNSIYFDLQAALNAGGNVTVLRDISLAEGVTVAADKTVVLDLNGKTITGTPAEAKEYVLIANLGNLTITDNTEDKDGKIVCDHKLVGSTGYAVNTISNRNGGVLTIEAGTIENTSTASNQIGYAIDNYPGSEVIIKGGKVIVSGSSNYYDGIRQFCSSETLENKVTIIGGEISSLWLQNPSDGSGTQNTKDVKGSFAINGGTLNNLYLEPSTQFAGAIIGGHVGNISRFQTAEGRDLEGFISGGTFSSDVSAFCAKGFVCNDNGDGTYGVVEKSAVAKIGDVEYKYIQDAIDAANATDVINVVSSTTENITIQEGANITLEFDEDITLNGYFAPFKGNLTINDGTINNTNSGASAIEINSGKLNLENVNISSARHAVRIDGAITATINGGEYTLTATSGTRHAVNVSGGAEVTITAGTFVGPKGTTMDSGSAVCVQAGAKVTIEGGDFSGGKNATLGVTGTMIVTGGTFDQDPSAYLAQGYITKYNETTSRYEVFKGVAKIEDEYFASIQDAIDAAENDDVIKVLNYIYLSDDKELNTLDGKYNTYFKVEDKTVTIDLNGKIIYVEYSNPNMLVGVFSTENNGHLTLMDSSNGTGSVDVVTKGNGVVYSLIANYESGCSITINGGTYKLDKASDSHIYSGCGCTNEGTQGVTVNGGVFYLGNVATGSNGSPWIFNVKGQNNGHVKVFGGTYNYNVFNQHWIFEAQTSKEYAIRYDGDETWTVVPAVAWVNNQKQSGGNWYTYELGYATLAEAIAAAEDCNRPDFAETVTLLQDITLENTITVNAGRDVILDLKGKTISGVCNSGQGHMFMVQNTADLTVKDSSENEEGKITYSRGTSNTGWVIDLEGDLILESGTIELTGDSWSIGYAVDVRPNSWGSEYTEATTFTMKGGKLVSSDAAVRVASSSADNHENVSANFIMNGGEIEAAWDGIFVQQSNAAYDILNVRINGGNIKSALSPLRLYGPAATSVLNNVENPITLNITGGTFDYTGNDLGNEKWLVRGVIMVSGGATFEQMLGYTDFEITGGTFEGDVNAYCAEGFAATNNDNGTWTVMPAQEQSLVKGWNWYSTYLDIETADLTGALGSNGVQIKNQDGGKTFYVSQREVWEGSLTLEHDKMYMINVLEACSLQLAADVVDATSYDIELRKGWSWIGYPSNQEIDINTALANFTEPNEGDRIKSQYNGYAEYRWGEWRGSLKTLVPGIGYMYNNKTETVKSFSYNFTPVTTSRGAVEANVTAENNYWTPNATKYPFNMTMTAVVDGLADANYEVAAFVNGEVRGSARPIYIEEIDAYVLFLTIHGEDVEEMSFRLYDIDNNTEYDLSDRINYSNNAEVGSLDNPYTFSRGTTGIGEASMSEVNIYPNPTTTGTEINLEATCDKVEVFNALGVKVAEYQNVDTIDALETAGIYVIRITNNGNVQNCRLVVK